MFSTSTVHKWGGGEFEARAFVSTEKCVKLVEGDVRKAGLLRGEDIRKSYRVFPNHHRNVKKGGGEDVAFGEGELGQWYQ